MENQDLWRAMNEAWSALTALFEPEVEIACEKLALEPRMWMLLLAVLTFEPETTTPGHLMVRGPYTSSEVYLSRLKEAAKLGYLDVFDSSKFSLTPKGRNTTNEIVESARAAMDQADNLPRSETEEIARLTGRLVQNCLDTAPPPNRWSIQLSAKLMPESNPPMPYIEQAFSCLAAYRDDAHLAAWQHSGLSATSLETLTLFWRGEVSSLSQVCSHLAPRGYSKQVYQDALIELIRLGYLGGNEDSAWITGSGRVFRNQVEEDTDKYFYAPWICLDEDDKRNLYELLLNMQEVLATGTHREE